MSRYIQLDVGYFTHRKTMRLRAAIGTDALWVMPALWCYALQNQPDGDFSDWTDEELGIAIGFAGDPSTLVSALFKSGYLEENRSLHNWEGRQSYARMASARARKAALVRHGQESEPPAPPERKKERKKESKQPDKHANRDAQAGLKQGSSTRTTNTARCTTEECSAFCVENGLTADDGAWFVDKAEGCGWLNGGNPIRNWRRTILAWKRASYMPSQKLGSGSSLKGKFQTKAVSWSERAFSEAQLTRLRDDVKFAEPDKREELRAAIAKHEAIIALSYGGDK